MAAEHLRVRPAGADDLPWIAALEARPDMMPFIGGSTVAQHRDFLADPDFQQTIAEDATGTRIGYALTQGHVATPGARLLRRIAVIRPGGGLGVAYLRHLIDDAFAAGVTRFRLQVFDDNVRARQVYARLGFVDDPERAVEDMVRRDGSSARALPLVLIRPSS